MKIVDHTCCFKSQAPTTGQVAKQILAEEGLLGGRSPHGGGGLLAKAITASMARNGTFNMVYFGFYHSIKDIVPKAEVFMSPVSTVFCTSILHYFSAFFKHIFRHILCPPPLLGLSWKTEILLEY